MNGNEKWIQLKIHDAKVMLYIWWDQKCVVMGQYFSTMTTRRFMLQDRLETILKTATGPPLITDLALFEHHLFRLIHNALTGIRFLSEQGIKNWLNSFLTAKPGQFFWDGIHKLTERWENIIALDGQ